VIIPNIALRARSAFLAAAVLITPFVSSAQSLADRVHDAPDGTVRFTFRSRPDVCGAGNSVHVGNGTSNINNERSPDVEWNDDCGHGPVRVVLTVHDHAVTDIHTYVSGRWRNASGVTDLGDVSPRTGADYLIAFAKQTPTSVGRKAIFPATLGDSVVIWPSLMQIARDARIPNQTRKDAVFWLGQMAGDVVTSNLVQLVAEDTLNREIRESAVFALSQQPKEEGVPALIRIAQTNRDPSVRKKALFWLGQSNDPRALALFEGILAGNGKPKVQ
jgi:hypothetical protein